MSKRTLRVALCMGGGVSLGSFSGGAVGEVVRLLREMRNTDEFDRVEFDVFSGASAGALSLGLMIKTLAHPDTSEALDSVLAAEKRAWVELIDIAGLIPRHDMRNVASLLDRGAVDEIARRLVAWKDGTPVAQNRVLADQVLFACTLSNLNGIPIDRRNKQQGLAFYDGLQTTLYRDIRIFALDFTGTAKAADLRPEWVHLKNLDKAAAWGEMAATSIACGAFPIAFEPVVIQRTKKEYGKLWPWMEEVGGGKPPKDSFPFTFSDGGMFNNEPLREAMQLINHRDAGAADIDRLLIFIDPNFAGTPFSFALDYHRDLYVEPPDKTIPWFSSLIDGKDIRPRPYAQRILAMLGTVISAVTGQASFKDWLRADKVNNQLAWRQSTLDVLRNVVLSVDSQKLASLNQESKAALKAILGEKAGVSTLPSDDLTLQREKKRVEHEEQDLLTGIGDSKQRDLFIHLTAMIDQLSGLRSKQQIQMLGIGPVTVDGKERFNLAGDFISSFGGFFEQDYRQYDYDVGVGMAGRALATFKLKRDGAEIPLLGTGAAIKPLPLTTEQVFGADPDADSTTRSKPFFKRAAYVVGDILDGFLDLPFQFEKLVKPLIGTFTGGLGKTGSSAGYRQAIVRVEFVRGEPDERFFLVGQDDGSSLEARGTGSRASAETVVYYWAGLGKPKDDGPLLKGPHVRATATKSYLEVRRGKFFGSQTKSLGLPTIGLFADTGQYGFGILTIEVKWPTIPKASAWKPVEWLRPLAEQIK